ncbi:MAG: DUF1080 domain-containing protein [Gemmataceae bacterium]|nr:DUF1080 domain-containing protein [Gemmataceae bacterium]
MRTTVILVLIAGLTALTVGRQADEPKVRTFKFSKEEVDKAPTGWKVARTGAGEGSAWKVVADPTAPSKTGVVLAQVAESPASTFNLCVADGTSYQDVEVKVAFKSVKGETDQGGGVMWRYVDANNYYVARYNPLEKNFRVYKVVAGKRTQLESKRDIEVKAGEWHTLSVKMVGNKIECALNGTKHLEANDDAFAKAGAVGVWTKADAHTYFDDLQVKDLGK